MDRRAAFFLLASVVCLALAPVAGDNAWVALTVAAVYLLLSVASWLDAVPPAVVARRAREERAIRGRDRRPSTLHRHG